jgi:hypothetical protein
MGDIRSREDLERWLSDKSRAWTQAIAIRSALRAIPYGLCQLTDDPSGESLRLAMLRAITTAWSNVRLQGGDKADGGIRAAMVLRAERQGRAERMRRSPRVYQKGQLDQSIFFAGRAIDAAAYAVARASDIAGLNKAGDAEERCNFNARGSFVAHAEAYAAARYDWIEQPTSDHVEEDHPNYAAVWRAVTADTEALEAVGNRINSARALLDSPLWTDGGSDRWTTVWRETADRLLRAGPANQLWVDWFERRIVGDASGFEIAKDPSGLGDRLVMVRLLSADNTFWERGNTAVTTAIRGWIDQTGRLASESIFELLHQGLEEGAVPTEAPDAASELRMEALRAFATLADVLGRLEQPSVGIGHNHIVDLGKATISDLPVISHEIAAESFAAAMSLDTANPDLKAANTHFRRLRALGAWFAKNGGTISDEAAKGFGKSAGESLGKAAVYGGAIVAVANAPTLRTALVSALETAEAWLHAIATVL